MIGPAEALVALVATLFSGGLLGLPLSTPPLPPDPVIERAAPDACLFHLATAGLAAADKDAKNLTEQMLADDEMREFLGKLGQQLVGLVWQAAPAPPEVEDAFQTLALAALTRPMAFTVEKFQPPTPQGPPQVVASLVIRTGDRREAMEKAVGTLTTEVFADALEGNAPTTVRVGGGAWQQLNTPVGPLSWGINDGSLVVTIGPQSLESLVKRMADGDRKTPAWKADLEKRLPVARRSTLTYLDAGGVMRIMMSLPMSDGDRKQVPVLLDALGVSGLRTVGASSGMTAEGVSSSLWLGFDGRPKGMFAAPATGIDAKTLARIPADATLAQAWSLDLSKSLAAVVDIAAATDPRAADEIREGLAQFRAEAGFDLDADLLRAVGPDWTVLAAPAPGGLVPNVALIAGVRDRATFAKTHKALLGILQNATAGQDVQVTVREIPYRGQTLFCLEAAGPGVAMPVTPTWCLTDDCLIVTVSPQFMKTLLSREAADGGLGKRPEIQEALAKGGDPTLVGYANPVGLVGGLCALYEIVVPFARGNLGQQGITLDLPQLPRAAAIMPYVRPSVTVVRHEADGILMTSNGTVPLGPLSAGGGVLGASPAAAPVLVALLLPAVQAARDAARRTQLVNNFRMVTIAMLQYESTMGRMPSQAICDKAGKPLLSWRVAMLPYMDEQNLYERFRLDEPWDSEHNRKLIPLMPAVYAQPEATPEQVRTGLTRIQVITGPDTAFPDPGSSLTMGTLRDGMTKTLAVVEAAPDNAVPWTKPDDVEFNPDRPLAGVGNPARPRGQFVTGFFDGHVQYLTDDIAPDTFKALVTPAGGEVVNSFDLE